MIAILELIVAGLLAPVFLLALALGAAADILRTYFNIPLLGLALSLGGLATLTGLHMTPDPKVPWLTVVDVIGQAHVFGLPFPCLLAGTAVTALVASVGLGRRASFNPKA